MVRLDSFTTPRLQAERLTPDHLPEIRRMHRDPVVMEHLGGVRDDAETAAYLERNLRHWAEYGFGLWILRDRIGSDPLPIGRAVLRHLPVEETDEIEVGYAFYPPYWGRGLATEVTLACLEIGRTHLDRTSFVAVTRSENLASQHVLTKAGLVYERDFLHVGTPHRLYRTV